MCARSWFVLFLCLSPVVQVHKMSAVDVLSASLNKLLDFVLEESDTMNVDGLFGIVIAEAQIKLALQFPLPHKSIVAKLGDKCNRIIQTAKSRIQPKSAFYADHKILVTDMWMINNTYDTTLLDLAPYNWTWHELKNKVFYGQPDEVTSDRCIHELIINSKRPDHNCSINMECENIMHDLDSSYGYPLAHKLLYKQVSRGLECNYNQPHFSFVTHYLCSRILKEANTIEANDFPYILEDLFMEQLVLCGSEGFIQFLKEKWLEKFLTWQSPKGCYRYKNSLKNSMKREASMMSYGCESHKTGLAAALMAITLRYSLVNQNDVQ